MPGSATEAAVSDVIEISGLSVSAGTTRLVESLSAGVAAGSTLALIGPSGCGKSTLLRTIGGLHRGDRGSVKLLGQEPSALFGLGQVQYLHQKAVLWDHLTARRTLELTSELLGVAIDHDRIGAILDQVGLGDFQDKFPFQLSVGQKARLALARIYVKLPRILLVDEPFAALDVVRRELLNQMIADLGARHQVATVIVTHDIVEALRFASRILVFGGEDLRLRSFDVSYIDSRVDPNALPKGQRDLRDKIVALIQPAYRTVAHAHG